MLKLLAALLAANASVASVRPITQAEDVLAVYVEDWGLAPPSVPGHPSASTRTKLVLVAWGDGYVVWSGNQEQGGPPYLAGEVEPSRLSAVLARAKEDGVFRDESLGQGRFGPDSKFTVIFLKAGKQQLLMRSWHELYEHGGKVVAKSTGLTPLEGSDRLGALRHEPAEYLYYRMVWSELRSRAFSLLPTESRPVAGEISAGGGVLSWREGASPQQGAGSPNE
jgi:hypothetical protein